jgi:predicted nucleic acid-binding Zn ribbon protein
MRNTNEQSIKQVISAIMQRQKLKSKITEIRIRDCWEKVMGPTIANRTLEIQLKNRILYIRINSAPLKHELKYNLEKLTRLLNDEIGETAIDEIVLL